MYTSIIKRCFKDKNIKYKWFYGNIKDSFFIERLASTTKSAMSTEETEEKIDFSIYFPSSVLGVKMPGVSIKTN